MAPSAGPQEPFVGNPMAACRKAHWAWKPVSISALQGVVKFRNNKSDHLTLFLKTLQKVPLHSEKKSSLQNYWPLPLPPILFTPFLILPHPAPTPQLPHWGWALPVPSRGSALPQTAPGHPKTPPLLECLSTQFKFLSDGSCCHLTFLHLICLLSVFSQLLECRDFICSAHHCITSDNDRPETQELRKCMLTG